MLSFLVVMVAVESVAVVVVLAAIRPRVVMVALRVLVIVQLVAVGVAALGHQHCYRALAAVVRAF
jgi:hypothetical protein